MRGQWKEWEQRARTQAQGAGNVIVTDFDRKPFMDAMSAIYEKSASDAKLKQLVERLRKVE
jgi:TRAP-type C4-dicarboxylate transport system substrate-binding protein